MTSNSDQTLLFGIIVLQMDFVRRDQLVAATRAWLTDKSRTIGEILAEQGALSEADRQLLAPLVTRHLENHDGDPQQSLAALSSIGSVADELRSLGDENVDATLSIVASDRPSDRYEETVIHESKASTSDPGVIRSTADARFRVLRPHAKGGLGEVYVAKDSELNREVALKEIQAKYADDQASRLRFLLEAEVTGGLEHPGIVPVYGLGRYDDGRPFYAMRFIKGDSLQEAADRFHAAAPAGSALDFNGVEFRKLLGRFVDVCQAIEYAHSRGVLHRDLKPGNIMLGKYGETLVVDWGLAKTRKSDEVADGEAEDQLGEPLLRPASASGSAPTVMGSAIGTPAFMPPEQAAGQLDKLGARSDVYSLGATLYYMLTGRAPFEGKDLRSVLNDVQAAQYPMPREIEPGIPKALEAVCQKAMQSEAAQRYATPLVLADEIERYLADEQVHSYAEPMTLRFRRWLRKHQTLAASTSAVVLVTVMGLAVFSSIVSGKNAKLTELNGQLDSRNVELTRLNTTLDDRNEQLDSKNSQLISANNRAREAAAAAKASAESEREQRKRTERALYLSDIGLATAFLDDKQPVETVALLLNHYPRIDQQDRRGWEWHYLLGRADPSLVSWVASPAEIPAIDWSSDGTRLATAQWAGLGAAIWNAESGELTSNMRIGPTLKMGVDWRPGANQVAFGSMVTDAKVRIFDVESNSVVAQVQENTGSYLYVRCSPDGKRIAGCCMNIDWLPKANNLVVWQEIGGKWRTLSKTRVPEGSGVDAVEWSPSGEELLVVGRYGVTSIREPQTLKVLRQTSERNICSGAWHPTQPLLACGNRGGEILIVDSQTMKVEHRIAAHLGDVNSVAWSPDGLSLASGGGDRSVKVWRAESFELRSRFEGHRGSVKQVCWHPDSNQIASCGIDGRIKIWPREHRVAPLKIDRLEGRFVWNDDETIRIRSGGEFLDCDARTGAIKRKLPGRGSLLSSSRTYRRTGPDIVVSRIDTDENANESDPRDTVIKLARYVWPDVHAGHVLAYCKKRGGGNPTGPFFVRDLRSDKEVKLGSHPLTKIGEVQSSPNQRWIVAAGGGIPPDGGNAQYAGWVNLFHASTGKAANRARLGASRIPAASAAWSPDSQRLVAGNNDGLCQVYEVPSLKTILRKRVHRSPVRSVSWHPDGDRIASGGSDGRVAIWDPATGDVFLTFEIKRSDAMDGSDDRAVPVVRVAWSPQGTKLAAMDASRRLHVWDAESGMKLANSDRLAADLIGQFSQLMINSLEFDTSSALDSAKEMLRIGEDIGLRNYGYATLLGRLHDDETTVRRCADTLVSQLTRNTDLRSASLVVWTLLLVPDAVDDYQPIIDASRRLIEVEPNDRQFQLCLAFSLLRAGRKEEAIRQLASAASAQDNGKGSPAYIEYVRAIVTFQHGDQGANKHLAEAVRLRKEEDRYLYRILALKLLDREAQQLATQSDNP